MKRFSTLLLAAALTAFTLACGYNSPSTTPAVAGNVPTITALSPDSETSGGAAFTLTVNGTLFSSTATINWNGTALATTYVSANQLTAPVTAADIAAAATVPITVTNPAVAGTGGSGGYGGSGGTLAETSAPMDFTVN